MSTTAGPYSQDFLLGGAIQRGDGPNEAGAGVAVGGGLLGCLRLHFERFEKLIISQTFNLQKKFFQIEYFTLQFFRMAMRDVTIQKEKSRKKVVNPHYSLGLMHDLYIVIFQQCAKQKPPGCFLETCQTKTSFRSVYVR